jgi:hypothetical protein
MEVNIFSRNQQVDRREVKGGKKNKYLLATNRYAERKESVEVERSLIIGTR